MNRNTRTWLLVVFCLVLAGLCGWQQMKIRELQRQCAVCMPPVPPGLCVADANSCMRQEKASGCPARAGKSCTAKAFVPGSEIGADTNKAIPSADVNTSDLMKNIAGMMDSPEMKEAIRLQQKSAMEMMYGSLFSYLDIKGEDRSALEELLLDKQMAMMEKSLQGMNGSLSGGDRKEQAEQIRQIRQEYDGKIKAFLGEEDYEVFEEYEQTQPERVQLLQFKQTLSAGNTLSQEQEHELILAMNDARTNFPFSVNMASIESDPALLTEASAEQLISDLSALNEIYKKRSERVLNETQQKAYAAFLEQQLVMQRVGLKMAQNMFGPSE